MLRFIEPASIDTEPSGTRVHLDWLLGLCLYAALCLMMARLIPETAPGAPELFWAGLTLLYLPLAIRIAAPAVARGERLLLLLVLAEATFVLKALADPTSFVQFDEFLHVRSASDILTYQRLFVPNDLLYVSPLYPGLELITTALINLTGLSVFAAGSLVIAACRAVFITALFVFFERITGSIRLAGIGALAYMGSTVYVMFDAQFAYETPAVALMMVVFMVEVEMYVQRAGLLRAMAITLPLLAALAVTHHVTDYFTAAALCGLAALHLLRRRRAGVIPVCGVAACAVVTAVIWVEFIGNPTSGYLAPMVVEGAEQLGAVLTGHGPPRTLYQGGGGFTAPLWLTFEGLTSVLVLCALLAAGFFTACAASKARALGQGGWSALLDVLRWRWDNSHLLLASLLALLWPVSVLLHLTTAGWEVGNRMNAFAFIGAGLVAAFGIVRFWRHRSQVVRGLLAGTALALIGAGGVVNGWGWPAVRTQYKVEGDALSVEPMGINAAEWTRRWLGRDQNFVADRDNCPLLATFGEQHIVAGTTNGSTIANLFIDPGMWQGLIDEIKERRIDYIWVDMRLTTQPALVGVFFESGEPPGLASAPLDPVGLIKWDQTSGVSRVFDDGWVRIYDVRELQHAP